MNQLPTIDPQSTSGDLPIGGPYDGDAAACSPAVTHLRDITPAWPAEAVAIAEQKVAAFEAAAADLADRAATTELAVLLDDDDFMVVLGELPAGEPLRVEIRNGKRIITWDGTQATAQAIRDALAGHGGDPEKAAYALAQPCPLNWCIARGAHQSHQSETVEVEAAAGDEYKSGPYLSAYLLDIGDGKVIAGADFGDSVDLDSGELRAEAAKIRAHCDRLEAMADQLAALEAGE